MNDGQIVFEVTADSKGIKSDLQDITKTIQQESKKWDDSAKQATDNMGKSFTSMLKTVVAGISAAKIGKALLQIGKDAVQAASDLAEVQNVVDVTFGDNAGKIESWAKKAGEQFGLTETQAKKFSSTMGAMLKSSGLAGDKIVDVSTDLAGLAADMASFYNLDFEEAFSKIRSGMSGMTMPLKELGIDMSVDTLNAFALAQGLEKTYSQMSQGEQTMLRYQYLMQATSDAQGDFARTSDEYANSMRKLETNIDRLKTTIGKSFIDVVNEAVFGLNSLIELLVPTETETVLDRLANIDLDTQNKLAQIDAVKKDAEETLTVLNSLFSNGNEEQGQNAAEVIGKYGVKADEAQEYLKSLGYTTDEITLKQESWLETCKRLVKTIPGLSSIINTETGEVKGGTQAVKDYVEAWAEGQKQIARESAIAKRRNAIDETFADLPLLEVNKERTKNRLKQFKDNVALYMDKYDWDTLLSSYGDGKGGLNYQAGILKRSDSLAYTYLEKYAKLKYAADQAADAFDKEKALYDEAIKEQEEYEKTVRGMGTTEQNTLAESEQWWADHGEAVKESTLKAAEAIQNLDDYVEGYRASVEKAVDSVVKGFAEVETPMMKNRKKVKDLTDEMGALDTSAKDYKDKLSQIQKQLDSLNGEKVSAQSMGKSLEQQAEYMDKYLANLRKARELGISNEVLAALSDGSEESYDYLEALAEAAPGEVEKINAQYQAVIDKKKEMTEELTAQQLTVDSTYQSLAEKAKQAVAELDQEELAKENTGKTIKGIAEGIGAHVPEVQDEVDKIIEQLDRLNGFGINIDFGGFGQINFTTSTGKDVETEGSGRMGLDYIPHDDYIARLHEGEKVLTAQEASIYRGLANGSVAGFDLDSLGGVMRDNIRPGGNVYLNGKVVGQVISETQGRSYKSLQRSGWQG